MGQGSAGLTQSGVWTLGESESGLWALPGALLFPVFGHL